MLAAVAVAASCKVAVAKAQSPRPGCEICARLRAVAKNAAVQERIIVFGSLPEDGRETCIALEHCSMDVLARIARVVFVDHRLDQGKCQQEDGHRAAFLPVSVRLAGSPVETVTSGPPTQAPERMATKYKADTGLPKEFPSVLKAFTREVLRYQPEDIYEFGAMYFKDLVASQLDKKDAPPPRLSGSDLESVLSTLFKEHDSDGNGFLDHREFKSLLESANLGLSAKEVKRIMAEADEDDDGMVGYTEFIPIAIDLIQSLYAKADVAKAEEQAKMSAREEAQHHMLHGMPRETLESIMRDIFAKADLDGSGVLSRKEFHTCIKEADLGLTRREINVIMAEVDADDDGTTRHRRGREEKAGLTNRPPCRRNQLRGVHPSLPPDPARDSHGRDHVVTAVPLRARGVSFGALSVR